MGNFIDGQKSHDDQPNEKCKAIQLMTIDIVECIVENSKCAFPKSFGEGWACTHSSRKEIAKRTRDGKMKT
jgi:hypothetical protein